MTFDKWFNKQSRLVQILLLLIPGVNWIVELLVRWSLALRTKNIIHVVVAVVIISYTLRKALESYVYG